MSDATESIVNDGASIKDAVEAAETDAVTTEPIAGAEALGDPGKKALDLMKAQRNAAAQEAREAKAERDALKAKLEGREAEHAAEQAKQAAKDEALNLANQRILKSELKAAATGKLADPTDAHLYIDLSQFTVSDDGDTDSTALGAAIADLITRKPHLAAGTQARFDGSADQGGKRSDGKPQQLTREELKTLTPEQFEAADKAGQLDVILGRA